MVEDKDMLLMNDQADDGRVIYNPWRQLRQFTAARIGWPCRREYTDQRVSGISTCSCTGS